MLYAFFDVDNVFFSVMGYPMSYLEFFGTILNIACVWLVARRNIWTWPIGIMAVLLFGALFYQIRLYSDFIEQIYYLLTGFYGWYAWSRVKRRENAESEPDASVVAMSFREKLITGSIIGIGTLVLGYFITRIHVLLPVWFPEAASFPYLDALTTVMSFSAQVLLIRKRFESWYLWIAVDIIGIWLYFEKDVRFVSLLYLIFLVLAVNGLLRWRKMEGKRVIGMAGKEGIVI